jgi:hypothetical protein
MWRVGTKVKRNLYRDDEPIAMLATAELAAEMAGLLNRANPHAMDTVNRWNIQALDNDDLEVCKGNHEKHEACRFVRYTEAK